MRTTSAARSALVRGRPGRRAFEPSYFFATNARKPTPAESLAFHGQAAALVVGEAEPSASMRCTQDAVLLEQVLNDRLLLPG
jgi:hypothetical protein